MTDEQKTEWEHLYDTLMEKPRQVFEIFSDYFGENRVDFQGFSEKEDFCRRKEIGKSDEGSIYLEEEDRMFILVWFPEVKVTNENNKSIFIYDLYVKVRIDIDGLLIGKFYLNRATYPLDQIDARYMHSHALINLSNFDQFSTPCTGNGPINSTIAHLNLEFDEGLWQLYCSELEDFTQVESLAGVPYKKLEEVVGLSRRIYPEFNYIIDGPEVTYMLPRTIIKHRSILDFTRYLLKSRTLSLEYFNGTYSLGMSPLQATILISNKFIEWFNKEDNPYRRSYNLTELLRAGMLHKSVISEGKICIIDSYDRLDSYEQYEGRHVCTFKGKDVKVHIIDIDYSSDNTVLLINQNIIADIVSAICKVVNFRYGRKEREEKSKLDRQTLYI